MSNQSIGEYYWVGSDENFVDNIHIQSVQHTTLGLFGGNSNAGQYKNEDGCIVWANEKEDWEFAVVLDAHYSAESAELVINQLNKWKGEIHHLLSFPYNQSLARIQETILNMFQEEEFLAACRTVKGETACLIVLRMHKYVWWFSIGDNICPNEPFSNPQNIYNVMSKSSIHEGITSLLETIKINNVRDSTTIISWDVTVREDVTRPSDEVKK